MKNLILFICMLFVVSVTAQYQSNIYVNPNQSKSKQYIGVALGGRQLLSTKKLPPSPYDYKGQYSSIYLPDFIDKVTEIVATQINGCNYISCDTLTGILEIDSPNDITVSADGSFDVESDGVNITSFSDVNISADNANSVITINEDGIDLTSNDIIIDGDVSFPNGFNMDVHAQGITIDSLDNMYVDFSTTLGTTGYFILGSRFEWEQSSDFIATSKGAASIIDLNGWNGGGRIMLNNSTDKITITSGGAATGGLIFSGLGTYADDAAAGVAGLTSGAMYFRSTGELAKKL